MILYYDIYIYIICVTIYLLYITYNTNKPLFGMVKMFGFTAGNHTTCWPSTFEWPWTPPRPPPNRRPPERPWDAHGMLMGFHGIIKWDNMDYKWALYGYNWFKRTFKRISWMGSEWNFGWHFWGISTKEKNHGFFSLKTVYWTCLSWSSLSKYNKHWLFVAKFSSWQIQNQGISSNDCNWCGSHYSVWQKMSKQAQINSKRIGLTMAEVGVSESHLDLTVFHFDALPT